MNETKLEKRRLEFKSDRSYKFWEVSVQGTQVTARYGRIGTRGRNSVKNFESYEKANEYAEKELAKKKKSGYKEVVKEKVHRKTNLELWEELKPHEPFLKTILESPDDVGNYLVYADWLMEQGDPRGEFIHAQLICQDPKSPMWEQTKQEKIANSIQRTHWRSWLGELSSALKGQDTIFQFRSGLLSKLHLNNLTIPIANTLKNSPHCRMLQDLKIFSTTITSKPIEVDGKTYDADTNYDVQPLMGADLGNIKTFEYWSQISGEDGGIFQMSTTSRYQTDGTKVFELIRTMPRLKHLKLITSFSPGSFGFLFRSQLPELFELDIENSLGDQPIKELCRSHWMEQLRWLTFHNCDLTDASCELLADSLDPNIMEQVTITGRGSVTERGKNVIEKTGVELMAY